MKISKKYLIPILFFMAIIFMTPITRITAYTTGIASVDQFRRDSVDVYQLITINYTVVGGGGSAITVIRSDTSIADQVQTNAIGTTDRVELYPEMRSVFSQNGRAILAWDHGIYDENTTYMVHETFFNGTRRLYNITDLYHNATLAPTATFTGYKYQAVLLPPRDVANYWCQTHNAILNSVDEVNLTMNFEPKLVQALTIQISENMTPDNNLANGYNGIPISAGIATIIISAAAILIKCIGYTLVAVGVGIGFAAVIGALMGNPLIDRSVHIEDNDEQTLNVNWTTPTMNQTELWAAYEEWATAAGTIPTVEGYYVWLDAYYTNIEKVTPDLPGMYINENWSIGQGDEDGGFLTMITGFLEDIMPIVIMIVIIVAMVWGFGLISRFMGKRKNQ